MKDGNSIRVDSARRIIKAPPSSVYRAFLDPKALASWLPPEGMKGMVEEFQAFEGGTFRMTLTYIDSDYRSGKTSENADVVQATFLELSPDIRIVQQIEFESEDPAYDGKMNMTWNLQFVPEGTEVTIICENVPEGIQQDAHVEGFLSTLANLAAYLER